MKIQFDVDGVLADFMIGASKLAQKYDPSVPLISCTETKDWNNWEGWSEDIKAKIWQDIKTLPYFFCDLPLLITRDEVNMIRRLSRGNDLYFVTSRPSPTAKWQTEQWGWEHFEFIPTVIVTKHKSDFSRVIKPDFSIEDNADNARLISEVIGPNRSYILDRLYNRHLHLTGATRVKTVKEFLEHVGQKV